MRYFFDVVIAGVTVLDAEGGDFASDNDAYLEALLVACELIGRELIAGKLVNWASSLQIRREDKEISAVVGFLQAANVPH